MAPQVAAAAEVVEGVEAVAVVVAAVEPVVVAWTAAAPAETSVVAEVGKTIAVEAGTTRQ